MLTHLYNHYRLLSRLTTIPYSLRHIQRIVKEQKEQQEESTLLYVWRAIEVSVYDHSNLIQSTAHSYLTPISDTLYRSN